MDRVVLHRPIQVFQRNAVLVYVHSVTSPTTTVMNIASTAGNGAPADKNAAAIPVSVQDSNAAVTASLSSPVRNVPVQHRRDSAPPHLHKNAVMNTSASQSMIAAMDVLVKSVVKDRVSAMTSVAMAAQDRSVVRELA